MKLLTKFIQLFYHRKYVRGKCITRILFFHFHSSRIIKLRIPPLKNIGKYTYVVGDNHLHIADNNTVIGSFCSIGQKVQLGHGNHPLTFLSTSPYLYFDVLGFKTEQTPSHNEFWNPKPIYIGNDVWIGDGVFIKNGITVGDGAVIGAHSVVTKDIPPYAIVAGAPARIIRYRFDEPIRQELLRLKWWDLPDSVIRQIPYEDIHKALAFLREARSK